MTISSTIQNGFISQEVWSSMSPPIAAACAIVPTYYGFIAKTAKQAGLPIPKMTIIQACKAGLKAAPTFGVIVGTQMVAKAKIENYMKKAGFSSHSSTMATITSSTTVALVSAPFFAIFNGQTMGRTVWASIKALSIKQIGTIVVRESFFLASLGASGPVSSRMKTSWGDHVIVDIGSSFITGAVGSLAGHPADTSLTLLQKEIKIEGIRMLMRGAPIKALATGAFSVCYKLAGDSLSA